MADRMAELVAWVRAQEESYNKRGSWSKAAAFQDVRLKIEEIGIDSLGAEQAPVGCEGKTCADCLCLGVPEACAHRPACEAFTPIVNTDTAPAESGGGDG